MFFADGFPTGSFRARVPPRLLGNADWSRASYVFVLFSFRPGLLLIPWVISELSCWSYAVVMGWFVCVLVHVGFEGLH